MTRDECRYCLESLADVFGHKLQEGRVTTYYLELQGYPLEVLDEAVKRLRRTEDSFPSLRKVLEACVEAGGQRPHNALSGCNSCEEGWKYKRRDDGSLAVYPCTCSAGDMRQRQVMDAHNRRCRAASGGFESAGSLVARAA